MEQQTKYIIEIATIDFTTTKAAVEGGADRIELCAALTEGGTTPSFGVIKKCRETFGVQLFPIIRPRSGDFFYSGEEYEIMLHEIGLCKEFNCDGVVIGMLEKDGNLPLRKIEKLIAAAYPMEVTFHRAFDRCAKPFEAMEQLIELGCHRILSSGQQPTALQGIDCLANLVKAAENRIVIMPGCGVREENIKIISAKTGATEFHSSLRTQKKSAMDFINPMLTESDESYTNPGVHPEHVRALRNALHTH